MCRKVRTILAMGFFIAPFVGLAAVSEAQDYWARAYRVTPPTLWDDAAGCVREVPDDMGGGYVVLGSTVEKGVSGLPFNILVTKLKDNGDVEWVRNLWNGNPSFQLERAYSIDVIPPALGGPGYVIAGRIAPNFSGPYDFLVLRLDGDGRPVWAYRFDFGWNHETATYVKVTTWGDIIVVGGCDATYGHFSNLVVMKLNATTGYLKAGPHIFPIPEGGNASWSCDDFYDWLAMSEKYIVAGWIDMGGPIRCCGYATG